MKDEHNFTKRELTLLLDTLKHEAFVRGYVAAVAEFARRETTPKRVLASANLTRELAVACKVNPYDLKPLRGQFAPARKKKKP